MKLSELKTGEQGVIVKVHGHGGFRKRIVEMGFVRAQTVIRFRLSENARNAFIHIFDMTGKTLKQIPVDSSMQSVTINGYELSSGMYFYALTINGQEIDTKRMILSK